MKHTFYILLAGIFLLAGCGGARRAIRDVFAGGYFEHTTHECGDVSVRIRELDMKDMIELFWAPQDIDDRFRTVHLQVSNRGGGVHFLYIMGTHLATYDQMKKYLDPERGNYGRYIDGFASLGAGVTTYALVHANPRTDPVPIFLFTLTAFSLVSSLIRATFFSSDKYHSIKEHLLFRDLGSNPLISIKPYEQYNALFFMPRRHPFSEISFQLTTSSKTEQNKFTINLADSL